jgi:Tfp pilus assembly protein PilN
MKDKNLLKSKFSWILGCSALFIALCAAFFSVYGISTLFAGAFISAVIMASSLEIGKLVGVTFLYRYWTKCRGFLKAYLISAILVLMLITSLGIFGYLSAAYQKSSSEFNVAQEKISNVQDQKTYYKDKIDVAKKRIDDLTKLRASQETTINNVIEKKGLFSSKWNQSSQQQTVDLISDTDKSIKEENQKIQESIDTIRGIDNQINQLKSTIVARKDIQTFKFVADALKLPLDTVARWFILCLIFVFDPLAISLVLAYNVAVYRKEDESVYDRNTNNIPVLLKSEPEPLPPPISQPKIDSEPLPTVKEEPKVEKIEEKKPKYNMPLWYKQMFKL